MIREQESVSLENLSDQTLLDTYSQAMKLGLDMNFIEIIKRELRNRGLYSRNEQN
ncbi:sporulation histidine kinase inhibitor Sda [Halobacillus salinus]|uniref:Sporulation histidine kinase inhibitor Sda n=1 Tax=Halobacillus salinus TaxID=192814 RepID=A0A4Z0H113_9BACI|nr:sporulation histidine kinase inhibitor Sda [Halobacillus salinus]TGB02482.1 sporulation histidine kinase inhibitor Sda [Halobacillus salinus]